MYSLQLNHGDMVIQLTSPFKPQHFSDLQAHVASLIDFATIFFCTHHFFKGVTIMSLVVLTGPI